MARDDGFIEVKRKGRRRKHFNKKLTPAVFSSREEQHEVPQIPLLVEKVATCRQHLKETQFYSMISALLESLHPYTVVCYGIGHVGTCHIARQQFAFLLELVDMCKPQATWVYDPVLYEAEKVAISKCGCQIITKNEHCKWRVEEATLFFMPHCGKSLYNNLLWKNWGVDRLSKMAIIGNSFSSYHEKLTGKQLLEEAPYLYHLHSVCTEVPFPSNHPDSTIFNDTSLHTFTQDTLNALDKAIWDNAQEPPMDPSDSELVI